MSDKDWMVTDLGWGTEISFGPSVTTAIPLTFPTTVAGLEHAGIFSPNDDWTLKAVRGAISVYWDPEEEAAPWSMQVHMAIEVFDGSPLGGTPALPFSYDLTTADTANRAFIWHHSFVARRLGSWLEPSQADSSNHRVEVHAKSARRVFAGQQPSLVMQVTPITGTPDDPRFRFLPTLRCLGERR